MCYDKGRGARSACHFAIRKKPSTEWMCLLVTGGER